MRIVPYWRLKSHPHEDDLETTLQKVRELVIDSITRQLVSDVPVCTFLSGGLDSSAITAIAAKHYQSHNLGTLQTFSVDYAENERYFKTNEFQPNADNPWIEKITSYLGTSHKPIILDIDSLFKTLIPAMEARDFPGMADIDSSLYLFCKEVKEKATVALSGECADEIFGGYPWFFRDDLLSSGTFPWSVKLTERQKLLSSELIDWIQPEQYVAQKYQEALDEVPLLKGENEKEEKMREMLYLNITRWMPTLLDRKDRMSMAVGMEVRVPFCDHRIVEYLWNVPWSMKTLNHREKGLLRSSLSGILPEDVLYRKKSPYPKTHHPIYLSLVKEKVLEILHDSSSPILPFINVNEVRKFAKSVNESTHLPWFGQLMNAPQMLAYLIQVDAWLRKYKVIIQ